MLQMSKRNKNLWYYLLQDGSGIPGTRVKSSGVNLMIYMYPVHVFLMCCNCFN